MQCALFNFYISIIFLINLLPILIKESMTIESFKNFCNLQVFFVSCGKNKVESKIVSVAFLVMTAVAAIGLGLGFWCLMPLSTIF